MRLLCCIPAVFLTAPAGAAERLELKDGDRVVLIGGTLIEREQRYGYWETALTAAFPDRDVTFRNLGWSGDTVWGEARAGFDTPREGYQRLVRQTLALKPTVIVVGYGSNESFAGQPGVPRFREQLKKLLDDLAPAKARIVLLAPPLVDRPTWKGGDPNARDTDIKTYTLALEQIAYNRGLIFVNEFCQRHGPAFPLTGNGLHLTAYGYWRTATQLLVELHVPTAPLKPVELDGLAPKRVTQPQLPGPPVPKDPPTTDRQGDCWVTARNLKPGKYTLTIDGRPVQTADAQVWTAPPGLDNLVLQGPSLERAERLRKAIVRKNELFFHRSRPENETYLFGFRKQEQGRNAREIPQFDPLIEQAEREIARLRQPVPHTYQLVPAK